MEIPNGQEVVYGGPYIYESAEIEAELMHAHNENRDPDLWGLFKGKQITQGGVELIKTYLEGHPKAGYEGERVAGENVVLPTPDYVFPGEGGPDTQIPKEVSEEDAVIEAAEVEENPVEEVQGKHVAPAEGEVQ